MKSFREKLFTLRSYTPIPFLLVMILFAEPTAFSMICGFVIVLIGELIRLWGVAYAGCLTRVTGSVGAPEVIVSGPFSHVRNPLYIGNILMYTGIGIMSDALFPWLTLTAAAWFAFQYYQIILLEEEFLEKEFRSLYVEFKNNVPRLIPRMSSYVSSFQSIQMPDWESALQSERRTLQALGSVILILIVLWIMR